MRKWKDISLRGWDSTIEAAVRILTTVSDDEILAEADTIRAKRKEEEEMKAREKEPKIGDWVFSEIEGICFLATQESADKLSLSRAGLDFYKKAYLKKVSKPTEIE